LKTPGGWKPIYIVPTKNEYDGHKDYLDDMVWFKYEPMGDMFSFMNIK
jgi:hypothetical protein